MVRRVSRAPIVGPAITLTGVVVLLVSIVNGADGAEMLLGMACTYPFMHLVIRAIRRDRGEY